MEVVMSGHTRKVRSREKTEPKAGPPSRTQIWREPTCRSRLPSFAAELP